MFNNNNNNPILNTFMQYMSMGNNPNMILQNIINQNPNYRNILTQMQNSGLSPRDYVMQYARQNNIDLNSMLQQINNMGIKL